MENKSKSNIKIKGSKILPTLKNNKKKNNTMIKKKETCVNNAYTHVDWGKLKWAYQNL